MNFKIRLGSRIETVLNLEGTADERGIQFVTINRSLVEVVGSAEALIKIAKECDEIASLKREVDSKDRAHMIRSAKSSARKIRDLIDG